eukprot:7414673-Alexandrium_andersonii.AAC.1
MCAWPKSKQRSRLGLASVQSKCWQGSRGAPVPLLLGVRLLASCLWMCQFCMCALHAGGPAAQFAGLRPSLERAGSAR